MSGFIWKPSSFARLRRMCRGFRTDSREKRRNTGYFKLFGTESVKIRAAADFGYVPSNPSVKLYNPHKKLFYRFQWGGCPDFMKNPGRGPLGVSVGDWIPAETLNVTRRLMRLWLLLAAKGTSDFDYSHIRASLKNIISISTKPGLKSKKRRVCRLRRKPIKQVCMPWKKALPRQR